MRGIATLAAAVMLNAPAMASPSLEDLAFLVGEWEGESTFHYPREPDRPDLHEEARATCARILKNTYIQCDMSFVRADGAVRTLRLHLNFNDAEGALQTLFIYDNWHTPVSFLFRRDETENALVGHTEYEAPDGERGEERIVWRISADRNELRDEEYIRLPGEGDDRWRKNFDFVWRRKK